MVLKNNNDGNFLQKSSAKNKIATIFYVNTMRVCKMQFHWSSRMEWPRINQSASATHQPYDNSVFLVSLATRTQFLLAITRFLVVLNIFPTSLPTGTAFFCFSRPPGCPRCAKDYVSNTVKRFAAI